MSQSSQERNGSTITVLCFVSFQVSEKWALPSSNWIEFSWCRRDVGLVLPEATNLERAGQGRVEHTKLFLPFIWKSNSARIDRQRTARESRFVVKTTNFIRANSSGCVVERIAAGVSRCP